jgi:hypothetical protein
MRDAEGRALRSALADVFGSPLDQPLADEEFNRMALRVFTYQYERNGPYAAFCQRRERTPVEVDHWTEIPPVPAAAFRETALVTGPADQVDTVFRTSGTTLGEEKRGSHYIPDLVVYHFSLIPNFAGSVLPDGAELRMLSLVPPDTEMPDSSLSHMVAVVLERLGAPGSGCYASASHGIDDAAIGAALREAEAAGEPVCLLGTSFAFVHWLDRLAARGERFRLPPGSRLMDTGGYKGRSREVAREEMYAMYQEWLGIPPSHCINEYGMTEMCSQFYDAVLRDAVRGRPPRPDRLPAAGNAGGNAAALARAGRHKLVPPWVRTRVVDPETLEPLPDGVPGLLQHFDLANAGSVVALQTEDLGVTGDGGFRLIGRVPGATPRGCSIAMDILLEALARRRP